jgi:hypothetical protein
MKHKILVVASLILIVLLLTACGGPPDWRVAGEGEACTQATVIDRDWADGDRRNFYLLLKADDGEIGKALVNEYVYDSLQIGDTTCVVR